MTSTRGSIFASACTAQGRKGSNAAITAQGAQKGSFIPYLYTSLRRVGLSRNKTLYWREQTRGLRHVEKEVAFRGTVGRHTPGFCPDSPVHSPGDERTVSPQDGTGLWATHCVLRNRFGTNPCAGAWLRHPGSF